MSHSRSTLLVFGIVLFAQAAPVIAAASTPEGASAVAAAPVCNGKYKGHLKPSPDELEDILGKHVDWLVLSDGGDDPRFANDPQRANLCDANLAHAHLEGKDLDRAHLEGADLTDAHLNGAHLTDAKLSGADLSGADLTRADLTRADLTRADLTGAQVAEAKLDYANLTGATYAPESKPPDPYVAGIKGLATLNAARGEQIGLIQLRKLLQDVGLRDKERETTCSIQRNITRDQLARQFVSLAWIEGCLRIVGFELTTAYACILNGLWAGFSC